jgi:hypothetical protein
METIKKKKFEKAGRPLVTDASGKKAPLAYNWFGVKDKPGVGVPAVQWPNNTNKDLSEKIYVDVNGVIYHPSPVAVYLKRKKMLEDGKKVACKKAKFTRSSTIRAASDAKKAKPEEKKEDTAPIVAAVLTPA